VGADAFRLGAPQGCAVKAGHSDMNYSRGRAVCCRLLGRVGNLRTNQTRLGGCVVLGVLAAMLQITSCGRGGPQSTATTPDVSHTYQVRGVVVEILRDALMIHHQAIEDYIGPHGQVVGMDPMVMRFQLAPDLHTDDFHVGDVLDFSFEDRPQGQGFVIVEAHGLSSETVLDFRAAHPRQGR
jgi:Cu/Ag efflux protein CusF